MKSVDIKLDDTLLQGDLTMPEKCKQLILFAHGSGSGRKSRRNRQVSRYFNEKGYATLLFDLLSEKEASEDEIYANYRFDINLLSRRMADTTRWSSEYIETRDLDTSYYGSSTGAAAAIKAAVEPDCVVRSVVSRGGRSDLAEEALQKIQTPVLFIVGGRDQVVMDINRESASRIPGQTEIRIVEGASHLFEEPGALEKVASMAVEWFDRHLHRE